MSQCGIFVYDSKRLVILSSTNSSTISCCRYRLSA